MDRRGRFVDPDEFKPFWRDDDERGAAYDADIYFRRNRRDPDQIQADRERDQAWKAMTRRAVPRGRGSFEPPRSKTEGLAAGIVAAPSEVPYQAISRYSDLKRKFESSGMTMPHLRTFPASQVRNFIVMTLADIQKSGITWPTQECPSCAYSQEQCPLSHTTMDPKKPQVQPKLEILKPRIEAATPQNPKAIDWLKLAEQGLCAIYSSENSERHVGVAQCTDVGILINKHTLDALATDVFFIRHSAFTNRTKFDKKDFKPVKDRKGAEVDMSRCLKVPSHWPRIKVAAQTAGPLGSQIRASTPLILLRPHSVREGQLDFQLGYHGGCQACPVSTSENGIKYPTPLDTHTVHTIAGDSGSLVCSQHDGTPLGMHSSGHKDAHNHFIAYASLELMQPEKHLN